MNYLPVDVYNSGYDCTNGGVTATHANKLVVPCQSGHITEQEVEARGYIVLELQPAKVQGYPGSFKPRGDERWLMFGGNFVYTSDSRFSETYGPHPIKVHDRYEG